MTAQPGRRRRALRVAALQVALVVAGILIVRREIWVSHVFNVTLPFWQEGLLLPFAAIDGAISGYHASRLRNVENTPAYRHWARFGGPTFLVLYVACAALCERLHFGVFPAGQIWWRTLGIVIVVLGIGLRIWSQVSAPSALAVQDTGDTPPEHFPLGPHKLLRYPDLAGKLLSLCGVPLCFDAWLPLLALPGFVTLLKWHINDQEAFRISQLGEKYVEYRKGTYNLVPYVF